MTFALHYALRSDVGLLREGNEDSAFAGPHLLAIADGMGGHAAGEVASAVAISAIAPLDRQNLTDNDAMLDALADAVAQARDTLHDMTLSDPSTEGMGTTLTALLWAGTQVAVCHIGDSRAYLLREGDLYQITRDHTLIQSLVDEGRLSPAAAANHPQRSLIMRALQGSSDVEPDLAMHEALLGDRYLLCSDGLTDVVGDEAVHSVLSGVEDAEQAVGKLIDLALNNGGPDNITCIVADVVDTNGGPPPPTYQTILAGAASNGDASSLRRGTGAMQPNGTGPAGGASASLNGHRGPAGRGADADDEDLFEEDDQDDDAPRRRWPLVTSILIVLVLVIGGGLYAGYRAIQTQYFVGADGNQLTIYRGVSQKIAGISLSSVYKRTGVPTSAVPADLTLPTSSTSLAKAQATVTTVGHLNTCKHEEAARASWLRNKPAPPKATKGHKAPPPKPYPPEPSLASYCQDQGSG